MAEILQFKLPVRHQTLQKYCKSKTLNTYLSSSDEGAKVRGYLSGFPKFGRMVRVLVRHIGFDLSIEGRSLLGRALEEAVIAGEQLAESKAVENVEVSDLMALTLVKEVSNIYDWKVAYETDEGLEVWDSTSSSFGTWIRASKQEGFMVIKHQVDGSEHEKLGLAIRLLCFGAEDEMIGRVVSKI
ncbi:hypothetical protein [Comamonas thiooxydans]|uniref:hypothetical protein n=1 Tax=Comamonas thiooxydans TaxID=363952 RepID=UPI00050F26E0|nr:hypothetical protein [Comamonas thiooxydans]KGH23025.1 hypothetical protein P606_13405 [Comamonas thiooxydans]